MHIQLPLVPVPDNKSTGFLGNCIWLLTNSVGRKPHNWLDSEKSEAPYHFVLENGGSCLSWNN